MIKPRAVMPAAFELNSICNLYSVRPNSLPQSYHLGYP